MNRRTFLQSSAVALGATVLLRDVFALSRPPILYGDGVHDDSTAFESWINGMVVMGADGEQIPKGLLRDKTMLITRPILSTGTHSRAVTQCDIILGKNGRLNLEGANTGVYACIIRQQGMAWFRDAELEGYGDER